VGQETITVRDRGESASLNLQACLSTFREVLDQRIPDRFTPPISVASSIEKQIEVFGDLLRESGMADIQVRDCMRGVLACCCLLTIRIRPLAAYS